MKELKDLQELVKKIQGMYTSYEDIQLLIEMGYEEEDPSIVREIEEEIGSFEACFEELRLQTLLSGEYDPCSAVMTLHAGAGGTESCDWAGMLYRMYSRWAEKKGFSLEVLDYLEGDVAGIKGVTFEVSGTQAGADSITKITRPHGRIVVVAIFGEAPRVDLHKFFWKEYQMRGARVYEEKDFDEAIAFLSEEKEKLRKLVTSVFSLDEIQQAFERIVDGRKEMKVLIRYE